MGKVFDSIDAELAAFVAAQPVFFVATAPSGEGGHVNVSPKGYDTLRVIDATTVAYLDLTGSGAETIAHVQQNGRITIMVCAFTGPPKIVRLYGAGEVLLPGGADHDALAKLFPVLPGARSIVRVRLDRVATSCGYAVPRMDLVGERDVLLVWAERKGPEVLAQYRAEKNARSIDGIVGLPAAGLERGDGEP